MPPPSRQKPHLLISSNISPYRICRSAIMSAEDQSTTNYNAITIKAGRRRLNTKEQTSKQKRDKLH